MSESIESGIRRLPPLHPYKLPARARVVKRRARFLPCFAVISGAMETYGELRTLIRALQARDALSADDDDLLPSTFPLEDNLCVLISCSDNCV